MATKLINRSKMEKEHFQILAGEHPTEDRSNPTVR